MKEDLVGENEGLLLLVFGSLSALPLLSRSA